MEGNPQGLSSLGTRYQEDAGITSRRHLELHHEQPRPDHKSLLATCTPKSYEYRKASLFDNGLPVIYAIGTGAGGYLK